MSLPAKPPYHLLVMTKRRTILIHLACGVLAVALYAILSGPREPSYQGRSLSQWLEVWSNTDKADPTNQMVREAMDAIGAKAIPSLLAWLSCEETPLKKKVNDIAIRIGEPFGWGPMFSDNRQMCAQVGFLHLGPQGRTAIPELVRLLNNPRATQTANAAAYALACVGTEGTIPPLLSVLTNPQHPAHSLAPMRISLMGTNALPLIPALVQCLQETNAETAAFAATTLGYLRLEPDLVVPALATSLRDARVRVRQSAGNALRRFGAESRAAVPALLGARNDPDPSVRELATRALFNLDPQALTNTLPTTNAPGP